MFFTDVSHGVAVGLAGTVLTTTDGGLVWNTSTSGTGNNLFAVYFTDANNGFAAVELSERAQL